MNTRRTIRDDRSPLIDIKGNDYRACGSRKRRAEIVKAIEETVVAPPRACVYTAPPPRKSYQHYSDSDDSDSDDSTVYSSAFSSDESDRSDSSSEADDPADDDYTPNKSAPKRRRLVKKSKLAKPATKRTTIYRKKNKSPEKEKEKEKAPPPVPAGPDSDIELVFTNFSEKLPKSPEKPAKSPEKSPENPAVEEDIFEIADFNPIECREQPNETDIHATVFSDLSDLSDAEESTNKTNQLATQIALRVLEKHLNDEREEHRKVKESKDKELDEKTNALTTALASNGVLEKQVADLNNSLRSAIEKIEKQQIAIDALRVDKSDLLRTKDSFVALLHKRDDELAKLKVQLESMKVLTAPSGDSREAWLMTEFASEPRWVATNIKLFARNIYDALGYVVFEVSRYDEENNENNERIRKSLRNLRVIFHPDKNPRHPDMARDITMWIGQVEEILCNTQRRRLYNSMIGRYYVPLSGPRMLLSHKASRTYVPHGGVYNTDFGSIDEYSTGVKRAYVPGDKFVVSHQYLPPVSDPSKLFSEEYNHLA